MEILRRFQSTIQIPKGNENGLASNLPRAEKWVKKARHIYPHSAILFIHKKNGIWPLTATWMEQEDVTGSKPGLERRMPQALKSIR